MARMGRKPLPREELERTVELVRACGANRNEAARRLGMSQLGVSNRLERAAAMGIEIPPATRGRPAAGANQTAAIGDKRPRIVNKKAPITNHSVAGAMAPAAKERVPAATGVGDDPARSIEVPPLSAEAQQRWEEVDHESRRTLWRQYVAGGRRDAKLLNYLLEKELPTLRLHAERILHTLPDSVELDDLVQEGYFGMRDAARRYDPEQTRFWTFAHPRVWGAMRDGLRAMDTVPRLVRTMMRQRERWEAEFWRLYERAPDCDEACAALGWTRAQWAASFPLGTESLEKPGGNPEFDKVESLRELLRSCEETPEAALEADAFWEEMTKGLSMDERVIFYLYHKRQVTMKKIGAALDLSESRISQMMTRIMEKAIARLSRWKDVA